MMGFQKKKLYLILTLLWLGVIWGHSLMPAELSTQESGAVFAFLQRIFPFLTHTLVRKLGHFSEYTVLGILLSFTARAWGSLAPARLQAHPFWVNSGLPAATGLLSACVDEAIQLGVEGRSGEIRDVLIDFGGVILGTFLAAGWTALRARKKLDGPMKSES